MSVSIEQQHLIEARIGNERKCVGITRALVGAMTVLFLAGCSQVKYAKLEVSFFDGDKLVESKVIKEIVVATYQIENVALTTSNDGVYLDAWKDSEDSPAVSFSTDPPNGRTVEFFTLADGSDVASNMTVRVRVKGKKGNTFTSQRVVESGMTWKIGSWLF